MEQAAVTKTADPERIDPNHPESGWGSLSYKISVLSSTPVLLVK
jgi:hypothetical protein